MHYFSKLSPRLPIAVGSGFVRFEPVTPTLGVYQTDDPKVAAALTAYVGSGRGGIQTLSAEEYADAIKKKAAQENLPRPSSQILETQTSGIISPHLRPSPPPDPALSPTPSNPVAPAVPAEVAPLADPPAIRLGKKVM